MKSVSLAASLLVAFIGALVLVGWALDIAALKSVLPGLVAMKANTAIGLMLSGLGLSLISWRTPGKWGRIAIVVVVGAVAALGGVTLAEYFFGWNAGIDQWLFHEAPNMVWTSQPGRMAPVSAFCFILIAGALAVGSQPVPDRLRAPILSGLGAAMAMMGGLAIAGCLAETVLHAAWLNDSGLAIHTALAFLLVGCSLLCLATAGRGLTWNLSGMVAIGFAIAIAIMFAAAGISFNFTNQLLHTATAVSHRQEVLKEIENGVAGMENLESGQRGYIILGDEKLLSGREEKKALVLAALKRLRSLAADDPAQLRRLDQLDTLIPQRLDFGDQTIVTRRQRGLAEARKMTATGTGIRLTRSIDQLFQEMQGNEYTLLDEDQKQSRTAATSTFLVLPLGVFLSLTISSLGLFFLNFGVGERVRVEKAWRHSEERFQTVIENLAEGLVISSLDGQLLHWNPVALALHGFSTDEDWNRNLPEFASIFELSTLEGEVLPYDDWPMPRIFRGESVRDLPLRIRRRESDWERVFNYGGGIVREPGGERLAFLTIGDITERTRSEEALKASEIQLGSFVEQAPVAMAMLDQNMVYLATSRRWTTIFGNGCADLPGMNHYEAHPDIPERWREIHRLALAGTPSDCDEELWVKEDGTRQWLRWAVQPWRDARGEIGGIMILTEDVTDRREAEKVHLENARLEEENLRFAEASRMKSKFLANMSHELRTPLNGIIGFTELMADERPGPLNRKQQEYIAAVLDSGQHLLRLINDVLDLAKVEAGKLNLEAALFAPGQAIEEVCAVLKGMANKKQVSLKCEATPALGQVMLDEHRFKQICYNLLSNAVKFTDPGGRVDIAVTEAEGGNFQVRVTDTGIGIKEGDLERLFQEFEQLESGASRRFEGTGLGLALTKRLVEMQGGSIAVTSEYGQGTTFTVVLPVGLG